jgi:hypothetical protein
MIPECNHFLPFAPRCSTASRHTAHPRSYRTHQGRPSGRLLGHQSELGRDELETMEPLFLSAFPLPGPKSKQKVITLFQLSLKVTRKQKPPSGCCTSRLGIYKPNPKPKPRSATCMRVMMCLIAARGTHRSTQSPPTYARRPSQEARGPRVFDRSTCSESRYSALLKTTCESRYGQ